MKLSDQIIALIAIAEARHPTSSVKPCRNLSWEQCLRPEPCLHDWLFWYDTDDDSTHTLRVSKVLKIN
jgi:hypothetical protein